MSASIAGVRTGRVSKGNRIAPQLCWNRAPAQLRYDSANPFGEEQFVARNRHSGLSAIGLAITGTELLGVRSRIVLLIAAIFMLTFGTYVWFEPGFVSILIATACGTLFCIVGLLARLQRGEQSAASRAIAGLSLSVIAAIAQQLGVAIDPTHFDHNATYHVILIPALGFLYAGLHRITT